MIVPLLSSMFNDFIFFPFWGLKKWMIWCEYDIMITIILLYRDIRKSERVHKSKIIAYSYTYSWSLRHNISNATLIVYKIFRLFKHTCEFFVPNHSFNTTAVQRAWNMKTRRQNLVTHFSQSFFYFSAYFFRHSNYNASTNIADIRQNWDFFVSLKFSVTKKQHNIQGREKRNK
jgi:hypothetical protein